LINLLTKEIFEINEGEPIKIKDNNGNQLLYDTLNKNRKQQKVLERAYLTMYELMMNID
jgi:hypothetical protein